MALKREPYPSDITREQFEKIRTKLEANRRTTRPRDYDLYEVFCAILYVVKEGITWRALPKDYPKWQSCYYYFRCWSEPAEGGETLFSRILGELVADERKSQNRDSDTTMVITDSKSIKNTDLAEEKGYDGGKKSRGSSCISP